MINNTNSSATTQSNSNCMNNPFRMLAWLFGKLVSIAKAGKRIFSDKSQPDFTPIAERMFSKAKAEGTFFKTPAPRKTTSCREMELYNPANRPLPMIEGAELQRLSWTLRSIAGGMKQLLEVIKKQSFEEYLKRECRGQSIQNLIKRGELNDETFKEFAEELNISQDIINKCLKMDALEKFKWLLSINDEQRDLSFECSEIAENSLGDINYILTPLIQNFITYLSKKYPAYNSNLANEDDIREFQACLTILDKALNNLIESPVGDQIARDANLQTMFSGISNKLQTLAKSLQISY